MVSKPFVVLCCIVALALADKYNDRYDNFDLKTVMESERLLKSYVKCLLDEGPCTPEGKELKDHLQEGIRNGCEMCTETQKEKTTTMIDFLKTEKKDIWKQLTAKFDPDGVWRKKYEDEAKKSGMEIPKE